MQQVQQGEFRQIDPALIKFSGSSAQAERRAHFDEQQLKELIASVREKGIVQPIVVRPAYRSEILNYIDGDPEFEVVAGERRVIAAREVGLKLIPAMIHELDDDQARDIQLIENLQREGLHELVECEGYEDLRTRGHSVEQIAQKVGRSASYVYKRLKLSECSKDVRKAFFEGKIDASKALLLAQLKGDDLQKKALKEISSDSRWDGPMSFRAASNWIRDHYMLRLDQAHFKTEDADLVPAAGACGKCPKNTAIQTGLFGDVSKEPALCTDSKCFQEKVVAAAAIRVKSARQTNQPVVEGKEAKKALQNTYSGDYVTVDRHVEGDSKHRTFQKLLGKDIAKVTTVAVDPESGRAVELVDKKAAKALIKEKGIKLTSAGSASSPRKSEKEIAKEKAERAKREADEKLLSAVARAVFEKNPKPFTSDELAQIADIVIDNAYGSPEILKAVTGSDTDPDTLKLDEAGCIRYIRANLQIRHIEDGDRKVIFDEAKRHGIDVEKIKAEIAAPAAVKAPTKTAAKKASKKK